MLRHPDALRPAKVAWAGATFLAPFAIFSMGAVGSLLVQQGANDVNACVRAFGYFVVLLNILAFFSPFVLLVLLRTSMASSRLRDSSLQATPRQSWPLQPSRVAALAR